MYLKCMLEVQQVTCNRITDNFMFSLTDSLDTFVGKKIGILFKLALAYNTCFKRLCIFKFLFSLFLINIFITLTTGKQNKL